MDFIFPKLCACTFHLRKWNITCAWYCNNTSKHSIKRFGSNCVLSFEAFHASLFVFSRTELLLLSEREQEGKRREMGLRIVLPCFYWSKERVTVLTASSNTLWNIFDSTTNYQWHDNTYVGWWIYIVTSIKRVTTSRWWAALSNNKSLEATRCIIKTHSS